MHTRRSTLHMALAAMLLAGSVSAQTGGGGATTDPSSTQGTPSEAGGSVDPGVAPGDPARPEDPGTMRDAPTGTSGIETAPGQPESAPRKKRRWWRRDGPLTPEERMEKMERESQRQERRQDETRPDTGGEPMGPTTTTPGEPDTRR